MRCKYVAIAWIDLKKNIWYVLLSGLWTLVILYKGQTTIWEDIEIYSQEKVYTMERLLVDKNIGLVNACNIK